MGTRVAEDSEECGKEYVEMVLGVLQTDNGDGGELEVQPVYGVECRQEGSGLV